jgi:peroxiredoxin
MIKGIVKNFPFTIISIHSSDIDTFVDFENNTSQIETDVFSFKGKIKNPCLVRLFVEMDNNLLISNPFYIDSGLQNVSIKITGDIIDVISDGASFNENFQKYTNFNNSLKVKNPGRNNDSLLYYYSVLNPDSKMALMELYLSIYGYKDLYEKTFNNFNDALKESYLGHAVSKKIKLHKSVENGNIFPAINLIDTLNNKSDLKSITKDKYIYLEFWHHGCVYCIQDFPYIKKLFQKYQSRNFDIISVSTDPAKFINHWKETIIKHQLPWQQYLDVNGIRSKELGIKYFPHNFILDPNGIIIYKNINTQHFLIALDIIFKKPCYSDTKI